jgi:hypothetical protein
LVFLVPVSSSVALAAHTVGAGDLDSTKLSKRSHWNNLHLKSGTFVDVPLFLLGIVNWDLASSRGPWGHVE